MSEPKSRLAGLGLVKAVSIIRQAIFSCNLRPQAYPGQLWQGTWSAAGAAGVLRVTRGAWIASASSLINSSIDVHNLNGRACMIAKQASKHPGNSAISYLSSHRC
jgi:hypothetical protein